MSKIIWVDVETNGLYPGENYILEIAALYEERGIEKSRKIFHRFCKPDIKPDDWDEPVMNGKTVTEHTGISWEFLEEKGLSPSEFSTEFISFLSTHIQSRVVSDKAVFAAYNANFDNQFVRRLFNPDKKQYFGSYFFSCSLDIMTTVALALHKGVLPQLQNYKNATLADHFGIEIQAHSAISDIKASRQIQFKLETLLGI